TGEERWKAEGTPFSCGDGVAVVEGDEVRLLDGDNGEERWKHDLEEGPADGEVWCNEEIVAFPGAEDEIAIVATDGGDDLGTVEVDWEERSDTIVHDDALYLFLGDEVVSHSSDGEERWTAEWDDEIDDLFIVGDDLLIVDTEETMGRIS